MHACNPQLLWKQGWEDLEFKSSLGEGRGQDPVLKTTKKKGLGYSSSGKVFA
jgi:hypothetical protein